MTTKATLTVGAAIIASFLVGWLVRPTPETHARTSRAASDGGMIAKTEYNRLASELKVERQQRGELEQQVADLKTRARESAGGGEPKKREAAAVVTGPRFHYDKYKEALKQVDWKILGESLHAMPPLMAEYFDSLVKGNPLPPSVGRIQRYNGPLVEQALKMQQAGMPGSSINGVFTHPVAQVNMIYATLVQAGKPLAAGQEERLGEVGSRFMELDSQRLAAYEPTTLGLKKLIEETALKDKFYAAVDALLTVEQRTVLHPPATAGYISADLFSSGLVWRPVTRPIAYSSREDLEAQMLTQFAGRLKLGDAMRAAAKPIIGAWSQSLPVKYLEAPVNALVRNRMIKVARVRSAAHAQLKLQNALLSQLSLTEQQRKSLRANTRVFVPFRQVAASETRDN